MIIKSHGSVYEVLGKMTMNNSTSEYAINEELLRLIQPVSDSLLEKLKESIVNDSDMRVIHVWNGYHLDDMEKYKIISDLRLEHIIEEMDFPDIYHAGIYVCNSQLKRQDLSVEYSKYLIGQLYYYHHALKAPFKPGDSQSAIEEIIKEYPFYSAGTIRKYSIYAVAMNIIFEQDTPFAKFILSGKLRISHENTIELSRLRPEEIRAVARSSMEEKLDHLTLSYIRNEVKWSHINTRNTVTRSEKKEEKARLKVTIRQMPEYDPDSEVNSLCLTIDSWISTIQRVKNSENFPRITNKACLKLMKKMTVLEHTINLIQESLVERTNNNG